MIRSQGKAEGISDAFIEQNSPEIFLFCDQLNRQYPY